MTLVRLQSAGGVALYIDAMEFGESDDERELSSGLSATVEGSVQDIAAALSSFADQLRSAFALSDASKYTVEFGCEIAVETGKMVAVLGKGSAKSTLKVTLEWDRANG